VNGRVAVTLEFPGAAQDPLVEAVGRLAGVVNYYLGNDPARWRTGLPTHEALAYRDLWPGVDLTYVGEAGRLKNEFHLAAGVRPAVIRLRYAGATRLRIRDDGALLIHTPAGAIVDEAPVAWQVRDGRRVSVRAAWRLLGPREAGFVVGPRDRALPLVIDPVLDFSTWLGGSGDDEAISFLSGWDGGTGDTSALAAGNTSSVDFPVLFAGQEALAGGRDLFALRLDARERAFVWCTYIGGSGDDEALGGLLPGQALLGRTSSPDFPGTGYGPRGSYDAFEVALNVADGRLTDSFVVGGTGDDAFVAAAGSLRVGHTTSPDLPLRHAVDATLGGTQDVLLVQGSGSGGLALCSYLGGSGTESGGGAIQLDHPSNEDRFLVAGTTSSTDFATPGSLDDTLDGPSDAFLARIHEWYVPGGGGVDIADLEEVTLVGGSGEDSVTAIAATTFDARKAALVAGWTTSADLPVRNAYQSSLAGGRDAFFGLVTVGLTERLVMSYFGGSGDETGISVDPDPWLDAFGWWWSDRPSPVSGLTLVGTTSSPDLPTADAIQPAWAGGTDGFVASLAWQPSGYVLVRGTYFGGSGDDTLRSARPALSSCYDLAGATTSTDLPAVRQLQEALDGASDALLARVCDHVQPDARGGWWGGGLGWGWGLSYFTAERIEDLHAKADAIEAKFDAHDAPGGPTLADLAQAIEDVEDAVAALEAKLDALPDLHALRDEVRALEAKTDAMDARLVALEAKADAAGAEDERRSLEDIERLLQERECIVSLWLPAAHGGRLERARDLVADLIARATASGDPSANPRLAAQKLADADAAQAAGDFQRACQLLSDALRAMTWQ
jgi:hypothetical protein